MLILKMISYTQNGFNVISIEPDTNDSKRIQVELSCIPDAEKYIGKFM